MSSPELFDRRLRRLRRDRAANGYADFDFLRRFMVEEILDRLDGVTREFKTVLDLGATDGGLGHALRARGMRVFSADAGFRFARQSGDIQCDEDRLPFADASFDLIVQAGGLDSVNDVPGALALARRALRPDGLFLSTFVGAGSLEVLKASALAADMSLGDALCARVHPLIDVRSAGDLLTRAGFALPVADSTGLTVRYGSIFSLLRDLRGMGATNILASDSAALSRNWLAAAAQTFAERADGEGKTTERFEIICLTGWAPSPDQPKPAKRGSGKASLASALKSPGQG